MFAGAIPRERFLDSAGLYHRKRFTQYVIDSYWIHRQTKLRGSKLGRYNGMLYFVPTCMEILIRLGVRFLQPLLTILVWALVTSTLTSMGQRLMFRRLPEHLPSGSSEKEQSDTGIK